MLSDAYKKWAEKTASGSTRNGLNIETLSKMPIPDMPMAAQKNIVRKMDALYRALEIQENTTQLLEEYAQNVFDYMSNRLQTKGKLKDLVILKTENKKKEEYGTIPIYNSGGVSGYAKSSNGIKESVIIPSSGTLDHLFYVNTPFCAGTTVFYTCLLYTSDAADE